MIFEWGKVCGDATYDVPYRLDFCINKGPLDDFKEGGNGMPDTLVTSLLTLTDATQCTTF